MMEFGALVGGGSGGVLAPSSWLEKPAPGQVSLTSAQTDLEAVSAWLELHRSPEATFRAYRKEAERLLLWCADQQLRLADFTVEAAARFKAFLRDPQPAAKWCLQTESRHLEDGSENPAYSGVRKISRTLPSGEPNPAWRPFVAGLSETAARYAEGVLFGLFEYLVTVGWLRANVWRVARSKGKKKAAEVERYLEREVWDILVASLDALPSLTPLDQLHKARSKFAVSWLYLLGLRRSELCNARERDLVAKRGKWWLQVNGKGEKAGDIPLTGEAVEAYRAYRAALGLTPWPAPGSAEPVLRDVYGKRPIIANSLHIFVKDLFEQAARLADEKGESFAAQKLRKASAHWLRHTAASHQLDAGVPLAAVRDNLRHANISTTSAYIHTNADERHEQTQKLRMR